MAGLDDPVLPREIWGEILARVPVKSILRCRSVCKSWYSLVSCPDFITHHSITNLHKTDGNHLLLQLLTKSGVYVFSSHDESCMESNEHDNDCSNQFLGHDLEIVGSCNGLICLSRHGSHPDIEDASTVTFLIWNPAIRKFVELRSLNYFCRSQYVSFVGFGFDSNTSDYKVMFILHSWDSGNNYCEVLDLKKGVWRRISPLVPPQAATDHKAECYVNGALHWSLSQYVDKVILSFNMSDESFREIRMPDCAEFTQSGDDYRIEFRCLSSGGLLYVIVWKFKVDVDGSEEWDSSSVWVMKEYGVTESWIKVSNIDLQSAQVLPATSVYPGNFILWAKCEILMLRCCPEYDMEYFRIKQDLVLYNTGSRKSKRINFITDIVKDLCHYKESLVLM